MKQPVALSRCGNKKAPEGALELFPRCTLVAQREVKSGRGEWIRTTDPSVPNRVLYQAEPRPDNLTILLQCQRPPTRRAPEPGPEPHGA